MSINASIAIDRKQLAPGCTLLQSDEPRQADGSIRVRVQLPRCEM